MNGKKEFTLDVARLAAAAVWAYGGFATGQGTAGDTLAAMPTVRRREHGGL